MLSEAADILDHRHTAGGLILRDPFRYQPLRNKPCQLARLLRLHVPRRAAARHAGGDGVRRELTAALSLALLKGGAVRLAAKEHPRL